MGDVNLKLEADQEALVRGVLKADDAVKDLIRNTTRLGDAGRRAGRKMDSGFKGFMKTAGKIAAGLGIAGGIQQIGSSVINQLRRELEHVKQQQGRAAMTQMTVGQMEANAILNKPLDVDAGRLRGLVKGLSDKYNVQRTQIWPHMGGILSAKGGLSWKRMAAATREGVRLHAISGTDIGMTAGGAMDVMRVVPEATAPQALGYIMGAGQQMRVQTIEEQMNAIVPTIASARGYKFTPEQATEMMAYVTMMTGDKTGRKGMSGTINFMAALAKATTPGGALIPYQTAGPRGRLATKYRPTARAGMAGLGELQDAWAKMTEPQRAEFTAKLPGQARTKGAFMGLIARDPAAMDAFRAAQAGIGAPGAPGAAAPYEEYYRQAAGGRFETVRKGSRIFGQTIEELQLKNPYALMGVLREGIAKTTAEIPGRSDLADRIDNAWRNLRLGMNQGHMVPSLAADELREMRGEYEWGEKTLYGLHATRPNPEYSPAVDEIIRTLIEKLDRMADAMEAGRNRPQPVEVIGGSGSSARARDE